MKKNVTYESPKLTFVKTELFENVAAECWAKPSLYCLEDPTDEDDCLRKDQDTHGIMSYADLADYSIETNGCNDTQKTAVKNYLTTHYGTTTETRGHYLTDADITTIMSSGGGNMGTSLTTSEWIHKVRS